MLRLIPRIKRPRLIAACILAPLALAAAFALTVRTKALFTPADQRTPNRLAGFPHVFLWAWERPEKLDFIDPRQTGVAYLARTIFLRGETVSVRPRLQPLRVPEGTTLIAVARIESERQTPPPLLSPAQLAATVDAIAELGRSPAIAAIQIDFDASLSERDFYRALLKGLRQRLPRQMPLTITALASWCAHDDWLDGLPIDEAIPMLFRMGVDERNINGFLKSGEHFRTPVCRTSAGVSTDEAARTFPSSDVRLYLFHTRPWTESVARTTLQRFRNEQEIR